MTSAVGVSMDADRATGSARRRRERRLRSWWRHERMSIAAALVEATHHSARGVGGQVRTLLHGDRRPPVSGRIPSSSRCLRRSSVGVGRTGSQPCPSRKGRCHEERAHCLHHCCACHGWTKAAWQLTPPPSPCWRRKRRRRRGWISLMT